VTNQQPPKTPEPRKGALDDPAPTVAPQVTAIFVDADDPVVSVRHDQRDPAPREALAQMEKIWNPTHFVTRIAPRLRDAGVTDFDAAVTRVEDGSEARTIEAL